MADTVKITPASRKVEFFNPDSASAKATISIDSGGAGDLTISAAGNINIGDISTDIYVGNGSDNVDIVYTADGEIRTEGAGVNLSLVSAENMTITTPNLLIGGKVGIGNTSPYSQLSIDMGGVYSNDNVTNENVGMVLKNDAAGNVAYAGLGLILDNTTDDANAQIRLARTSGTAYLGLQIISDSRDGVAFLTGNGSSTERMRIADDGKVGIGTDDPSRHLHVDAGTENLGGIQITSGGVNATLTITNDGTNGGEYRISVSSGNHGDGYNKLLFQDGVVTKMALDSSGKLGIGTTSPDTSLHIVAGTHKALTLERHNATVNNGVGIDFQLGDSGSTTAGHIYGTIYGVIEDPANGAEDGFLSFYTSLAGTNAEKMRITSAGQLDFADAGSIQLANGAGATPASDHVRLCEENDVLRIDSEFGHVKVGPQNATYMHFVTDRGLYYFNKEIVVDNGVIGSHNEDLYLKRARSSDEQIHIADNSMTFTSAGNDVVTIDGSNSRVGIGDTTPTFKLDVNGTLRATGNITGDSNITAAGYLTSNVGGGSFQVVEIAGIVDAVSPATDTTAVFQSNGTLSSVVYSSSYVSTGSGTSANTNISLFTVNTNDDAVVPQIQSWVTNLVICDDTNNDQRSLVIHCMWTGGTGGTTHYEIISDIDTSNGAYPFKITHSAMANGHQYPTMVIRPTRATSGAGNLNIRWHVTGLIANAIAG